MDINDLIKKAAWAYPDELLMDYWNFKKEPPRKNLKAGDTLAYFIVEEIYETFDADASDMQQLDDVIHTLNSAISDIKGVVSKLREERGKKNEKGWKGVKTIMSKHSKGPWEEGYYQRAPEKDGAHRILAPCPSEYRGERPALYRILIAEVYGTDEAAGEANARLVAAAPELLEACKAAIAVINDWLPVHENRKYTWDKLQAAITAAEEGKETQC